jgi:hypothetical protein
VAADPEIDDRIPRRTLDKRKAARHLIHTAIRLIAKMEDPFAIHLLVQSAEKVLHDIAKKQSKLLRVYWEDYIKDEYHSAFFKRHRAIYNYFKHADEDFAEDLPVHDIMMLNVMQLFIAIANYTALFAETTDHMILFHVFTLNLSPQLIHPESLKKNELLKALRQTQHMTPGEFFDLFEQNTVSLPRFHAERAKDLQDIIDFYEISFTGLRNGETKSQKRIYRLPS